MNRSIARQLAIKLTAPLIASLLLCLPTQADEAQRTAEAIGKGDVAVTRQIAKRVTNYALERYGMRDLASDAEIKAARGSMYEFLKWKLGSPSAVTAQWVSAGYGHFNKSYGDEAAALLLGVMEFQAGQPDLVIPEWFLDAIGGLESRKGKYLGVAYFTGLGMAHEKAAQLTQEIREAIKQEIRKRVRMHIPKAFDIKDRLIEDALQARRTGELEVDDAYLVAAEGGPTKGPGITDVARRLPDVVGREATQRGAGGGEPDAKPLPDAGRDSSLDARMAELERRVARLEALVDDETVGTGGAAASGGGDDAPARRAPHSGRKGGEPMFALARIPDFKGRTGQLVIAYPDKARPPTWVSVYRAGAADQKVKSGRGPSRFELLPGKYQIAMHGKRLEDLPLRAAHKTVVEVGVLKVHLSDARTWWTVLDEDGETELTSHRGPGEVALLPGRYHLRLLGTSEPVTIEAGKVTEF